MSQMPSHYVLVSSLSSCPCDPFQLQSSTKTTDGHVIFPHRQVDISQDEQKWIVFNNTPDSVYTHIMPNTNQLCVLRNCSSSSS